MGKNTVDLVMFLKDFYKKWNLDVVFFFPSNALSYIYTITPSRGQDQFRA